MSRKSDLTFKKKQELVDIILRKDNVEKEFKEKNEELTSQVQKLTYAKAEGDKKNGKLTTEISTLKENIADVNNKLTATERELFSTQINNSRKTIIIICLVIIAIVGWII